MWFLQTSTHASISQYDEFNECCSSLFPAWLDKLDENPGSTLQVNSEEYLDYLTIAQSKGEIIVTVGYALDTENIFCVYLTSCVLRFVPLVGNRALNQYMDPVG